MTSPCSRERLRISTDLFSMSAEPVHLCAQGDVPFEQFWILQTRQLLRVLRSRGA